MPEITYWINEGAPYIEKGSFCDGPDDHLYASKYFNGMHVSNPTRVKLWSLGWPHVINATLSPAYTRLNGNNIGYPDITESHFCFPVTCEVLLRWNNISTDYLDSSSNFLEYYDPEPHYERAFAEVLIVQRGEPDLVIADKWVCWPDNCTICYNVTNIGTGTAPACHNTTLYVDGVEVAHDHVPVDLAPNASYIGCFEDYNWVYTPPEDNITVCADSNNDVDEGTEESNNCLTNIWKCGDVDGNDYITTVDVGLLSARRWEPGFSLSCKCQV